MNCGFAPVLIDQLCLDAMGSLDAEEFPPGFLKNYDLDIQEIIRDNIFSALSHALGNIRAEVEELEIMINHEGSDPRGSEYWSD